MVSSIQKKKISKILEYAYKVEDISTRNDVLSEEQEMTIKGYLSVIEDLIMDVKQESDIDE